MTHVKKRRKPVSSRIFDIVVYILLFLVAMVTIVPFLQVVTISLSPPEVVASYGLHLIPTKIDLEGYRSIFKYKLLWTSYRNTIVRTLFGTALSMFLYVIAAYPLSKKYLPNRRFWIFFIIFTMYFSGGMIPNYLLINNWLKLSNTIWALILPGAVPLGNVILLMNAFRGVPKSLEEAAMIDGGSQWVILLKVFLPVVKPTLAAVTLFTIVGHWNDYFSALVYITDTANYPLQTYIQQLNVDITEVTDPDKLEQLARISSRTLNSAKIVVSTIPLLMIYP